MCREKGARSDAIARSLSQAVCAELERKYRLPRSAILLSVSHTHTGPVVGSNLNAMYFLDAEQQKLVADLIPSQISAGAVQRVLRAQGADPGDQTGANPDVPELARTDALAGVTA